MTDSVCLSAIAKPAFLALGAVGFIASAPAYAADAAADADQANPDKEIVVTGEREGEVSSTKSTAPLIDTPQTVTIVSSQTLRDQNLLTLKDALATVPGITFGAGEGGGGYGDNINLRGYSASNDITVDGVRDSAQYSRTDPFNLQQIEVYNGANSAYSGSGSVGGTINLVSKKPGVNNLTIVQGSVGTDNYYRGTIDSNVRLSDFIAVRLNAVYHRNDVPGRDVEHYKRWGVAPSITFGVGGDTSLTLAYVHQRDDNTPIYGVPFYLSLVNNGPLPGVDDSDYFGIVNLDEQETTVDRLTATFDHDFGGGLSFRNTTRWQRVHQYSQTSAPQGTWCLTTTGLQPVGANGTSTTGIACPAGLTSGEYRPSGPRGLVRDQVNDLMYNQADFKFVSGEAGKLRNTLVIGGALAWEDYSIITASLARNPDGSAVTLPDLDYTNPNTVYTGPVNFTVTARSRSNSFNKAIYAFDTLEIGTMFEINAGIRYENNRATFRSIPLASYPPGTTPLTELQIQPQRSDETLFSYRFGAVFKPAENISVYAAYANSKTPSSATVRLGCGVQASPTAADPCAVAPERARSYEIGVKADLLDGKLFATAALFRNERSNFRVPSNDPAQPAGLQVLDGRSRVDGFTLGLSGNIKPAWKIFANYTYLDSTVLQSVSDFVLNGGGIDPQRGNDLIQTPKHSGSLYTSYTLPFGLEVGYGATYQGRFATNQTSAAQLTQFYVDDWLTHRLFFSYGFGNGLTAQVNVQNVTNEKYYTGVRNNFNATTGANSGGWATPGEGRSAVFSLFYSF